MNIEALKQRINAIAEEEEIDFDSSDFDPDILQDLAKLPDQEIDKEIRSTLYLAASFDDAVPTPAQVIEGAA